MQAHQGILSSHQKLLDFMNRSMDILQLYLALNLTHMIFDRDWIKPSTLIFLFAVLYFQLGAALAGIYASQRSTTLRVQLRQILVALGGTFILLAMTADIINRLHNLSDRQFLLVWLVLSTAMLGAWRVFVRRVLNVLRRRGYNTRQAAIVGAGPLGLALAQKFNDHPWMGIEVVGFYDEAASQARIGNTPVHQSIDHLLERARQGYFRHIYITLPVSTDSRMRRLIDELADSACSVFLIPDIFVFDLLHARQTTIDGLPAISIYDTPFSIADSVLKRGFDVLGSVAILAIVALPMLMIALAVRLTSKGPILFKQTRYGLDGQSIEVWKFRTMTSMDNGHVIRQAQRNDSRLTPIGGFLRKTSLDELPQFINVLGGQMSIVGPRPHAIAHNEEYRKLIKGYMLRHKVKPGITGWAQVNGWRGETDTLEKMEKRVQFDLAYIRNWNIWLDVKIVLMTVSKGFTSKNAY